MLRMCLRAVIATGAILTAASAASAQTRAFNEARDGVTYFNRPGATAADHNGDLQHCSNFLFAPPSNTAPANSSIIGRLVWGRTADRYIRGSNLGRLETCMTAKGWRVYQVPAPSAAELSSLEAAALTAAIGDWVGAAEPPGTLLREWRNEGARPQGVAWVGNPNPPSSDNLSLRMFDGSREAQPPATPAPAAEPATYQVIQRNRDLRSASPPAGMGIVVFRVIDSGRDGGLVGFVEKAEGPDEPGPLHFFQGMAGNLFRKREGNWYSFTVPAGRWMLGETGRYSFCLGAPSFEVPAGEIIYAGTFDLGGQSLGPDLSLEPAREHLGAAGDRARTAVYDQNGGVFPCIFFGPPYALELEGAQFPEDYRWGSRAGGHTPSRAAEVSSPTTP